MARAAASLASSASPRTAVSFASAVSARDAASLTSTASARAAAAISNVTAGGDAVYAEGVYEPGIYEEGGGAVIYLPAASLGGSASLRDRGFLQAAIPPADTVTLSGEVVTYLGSPVTVSE